MTNLLKHAFSSECEWAELFFVVTAVMETLSSLSEWHETFLKLGSFDRSSSCRQYVCTTVELYVYTRKTQP